MATVTLEINDNNDFQLLLRIAEKFGAKLLKKKHKAFFLSSKFKNKEESLSLFGIGKNKHISLEQIREQAWGRQR